MINTTIMKNLLLLLCCLMLLAPCNLKSSGSGGEQQNQVIIANDDNSEPAQPNWNCIPGQQVGPIKTGATEVDMSSNFKRSILL